MVSKKNVIAAVFRARDLEQVVFKEEHIIRVVGHIHLRDDGTVEFSWLRRWRLWHPVHGTSDA